MNVYHIMLTPGLNQMAVNGRPLMPAPAARGNPWQRYALTLMNEEFGSHHPVSYLLLGRYLPAGLPAQVRAMPTDFQGQGRRVMELTSADIDRAAASVFARLSSADETHLVGAISRLDFPLVEGLLAAGVVQSRKTTTSLLANYAQSGTATSGSRRETLRVLLRGGLDPCAYIEGRSLLHHLCAGAAPVQDVSLLLEVGAHKLINNRDGEGEGDTPLLSYCRRGPDSPPCITGLTLLLDHGADPNLAYRGETAYTMLRDSETLAEMLLVYGAEH